MLEASAAIFRDPRNSERRFLPVLIEDVDLPPVIAQYRYLDCRRPSRQAYQAILDALTIGVVPVVGESRDAHRRDITIHHVEDEPEDVLWLSGALENRLALDGYALTFDDSEHQEPSSFSFAVTLPPNIVRVHHRLYATPDDLATALTLYSPSRELLITDMMFGNEERYANDGLAALRLVAARIPRDRRFVLTAYPQSLTPAAMSLVDSKNVFAKPPDIARFVTALLTPIRHWL